MARCDLPDVSLPRKHWDGDNYGPNRSLEKAPPDQAFDYPSHQKRDCGSAQKICGDNENAACYRVNRLIASTLAEQEKD